MKMTDPYFKNQFKFQVNQRENDEQKNAEIYTNLVNKPQFSLNGFRQSNFNLQNPNYMCINQDQYQNNIFNSNITKLNNTQCFAIINSDDSRTPTRIENGNINEHFFKSNQSFINKINNSQLIQSSLVTSTNETNEFELKNQIGLYKYIISYYDLIFNKN